MHTSVAALGLERSLELLELMSQMVVSPREDITYPRTDATDGCEPPCGCWSSAGAASTQPMSHFSCIFFQSYTYLLEG